MRVKIFFRNIDSNSASLKWCQCHIITQAIKLCVQQPIQLSTKKTSKLCWPFLRTQRNPPVTYGLPSHTSYYAESILMSRRHHVMYFLRKLTVTLDDWELHLQHSDPSNFRWLTRWIYPVQMCIKYNSKSLPMAASPFHPGFLSTIPTWWKIRMLLIHYTPTECYKFLHIPRQHSCRVMCKNCSNEFIRIWIGTKWNFQ